MQGKTLFEVYKHPSKEKIESWERIRRDIDNCNGYNVIVRGCSYNFSVTYEYRDKYNHKHIVYVTRDNNIDRIVWSYDDVIAVHSISAYSGYCILHLDDERVISCYYYDGKISDVRCTKIYYTMLGRPYFRRNKFKLYLDEFLKI